MNTAIVGILSLGVLIGSIGAATAAPAPLGLLANDQSSSDHGRAAQSPDQAAPPASTSDTLSKSNGVIRPPPTGDHSVVTPPPTETTNKAVIAPPGSPGGDQNVQPK
jgi:hypothetical protein